MGDERDGRDEGASDGDGTGSVDRPGGVNGGEGSTDRPAGRLQPLVDLLDGLLTIAESDRIADGREHTTTESGISVSSVDEFLDRRRAEAQSERTREAATSSGRSEPTTKGKYHVDTQFDGQEFVVVADVLGASMEEIAAGLTPDCDVLMVRREGETVVRVDLPWESATVTRAWFNNGVLEIRLQPETV